MTLFVRILACGLSACFLGAVWAQTPVPPEVAARSYILVDVSAGQVLAEQQADEAVEPASLTKLMTAYVVFDALRAKKITLQQTLAVSVRAWKMPGSRIDRKSTRLNSSHSQQSRMPSSA